MSMTLGEQRERRVRREPVTITGRDTYEFTVPEGYRAVVTLAWDSEGGLRSGDCELIPTEARP